MCIRDRLILFSASSRRPELLSLRDGEIASQNHSAPALTGGSVTGADDGVVSCSGGRCGNAVAGSICTVIRFWVPGAGGLTVRNVQSESATTGCAAIKHAQHSHTILRSFMFLIPLPAAFLLITTDSAADYYNPPNNSLRPRLLIWFPQRKTRGGTEKTNYFLL